MSAGNVDSSIRQGQLDNSISSSKQKSVNETIRDLVSSTVYELAGILKEIADSPEGSEELKDGLRRHQVLFKKFALESRRIVGFDKLDAIEKRLDNLLRKPWDDPEVVKKANRIAQQIAPGFDWINNLKDFSQLTWKNVKVFRQLEHFQDNVRCSKNNTLINKTADIFNKFKKTVDAYKPTFWQKIWQVITLRFTFMKVNQIREYLEDLDIPYMTESVKS